MERRWWLLGALLVIAIAAGFGIGSAVKSNSTAAHAGSLASQDPAGGGQASVARPGAAVPVPPLKAKATATHTTTSASSTTAGGATSTAATTATTTQAFSAPPASTTTSSPPASTTQTTSGGGGGGGGGG
jgi:hypothetical protein